MLASRSPQRREILARLGVHFEVQAADIEELGSGVPEQVACENARRKAFAVRGRLVLGVDTIVALGSTIYGKPRDEAEARRTLRALSGRTHRVLSGLAVLEDGVPRSACVSTRVSFRIADEALLDWYLACGEWRERAGGYAIQGRGAALVSSIEGDYTNVVGLPVAALLELVPGLLNP